MFQLSSIDLNSILPIAGLVLIAVVCIGALLVSALLRSRIALLIAVVIGVVVAGPALAGALTNIVWALVPLGVVIVVGVVAGLWVVSRNPDLMALARDVVPKRQEQGQPPVIIDQLQAPRTTVQHPTVRRSVTVDRDRDTWGFG